MGYLHLNSGTIDTCDVEKVTESNGNIVIHLSINTDKDEIRYRICTDTRQPNLDDIFNDLNSLVLMVRSASANLQINEYLERSYIYVTYPDERILQYTANRI